VLAVKLRVLHLLTQRCHVDPQLLDESGRRGIVGARTVDLQRAAVQQQRSASELELVPLGVAAEVVMIVEYENADVPGSLRTIEVGGGQSTDASPHHHQVVTLPGVDAGVGRAPVAQGMSVFK
jgi:hypothetical protein